VCVSIMGMSLDNQLLLDSCMWWCTLVMFCLQQVAVRPRLLLLSLPVGDADMGRAAHHSPLINTGLCCTAVVPCMFC
jgi:hypothetical protein